MTLTTADDFLALGETEESMELIEGEIIVMNRPRFRHQHIIFTLGIPLRLWCEAEPGRGYAGIEFDHRLDDRNVFAPDLWWVREGRRPTTEATHLVGPPDLAVEVRSESTWRFDIGRKKRAYERNGLRELWLIDTGTDSVLVYRRSVPESREFNVELELVRGEVLTSPELPGFELDITALFDA